jgi:hypothetical protein
MNIDFQSFVDIVLVAALGAVGYFYRQLVSDQKELQKDLVAIRIDLPKNYVSRDDMMSHLARIESMLNKIFDRLEQKVDK